MTARTSFTVKSLDWLPYVKPVEMAEASAEQLAAMQVTPSNTKVSAYVRTLAHDPDSYVARTVLFNAIMYAKNGLARAERELGALATSSVNGCAYCGSVHARRYIELSGRTDVVEKIYREGLTADFEPRIAAIVGFAGALSQTPPRATDAHVKALLDQGFSKSEILDLVHCIAIFAWANRLMHTLGHGEPKTN